MAKEPDQRYHTAGEMEQALQQALKEIESGVRTVSVPAATGQTQVVPPTAPPAAKSGSKIGPWLIGGGAVVALLCLLGGGLLAWGVMSASNLEVTSTAERSTPVGIGIEKTSTPTPTSILNTATPGPHSGAGWGSSF
jgi:hypothetical protein